MKLAYNKSDMINLPFTNKIKELVISDGREAKIKIIEHLSTASSSIKIAMAYFTDMDIAQSIVQNKKARTITCLISDEETNSEVIEFLKEHVEVHIAKRKGYGMMHHKFCVIDDYVVIQGSYNFTNNASLNNKESLQISSSKELAAQYSVIFNNMINEYKDYNSIQTGGIKSSLSKIGHAEPDDYLENFTDELKTHVTQIFDNYNEADIVELGKERAKATSADESVFSNYLDSVLEDVNSILNRDEHTKTLVKTRIKSSFERATASIEDDEDKKTQILEGEFESFESSFSDQLKIIKDRKSGLNDELHEISVRINSLNSEIEEYAEESDNIDLQLRTQRFWTFPTILKGLVLLVFVLYLVFFFGSAVWKIFFEENAVMDLLLRGITPEAPPLVDANALGKIFSTKGFFFGMLGAIFWLIPVLLVSIKLIKADNKFIEILGGWIIGIFVIDIVVAILISQHTLEIRNLVIGVEKEWTLEEALRSGEFWLIFIFGSLPLFLTKFLVESIYNTYNMSNPEYLDREKFLRKKQLKKKRQAKELDLENIEVEHKKISEKIEEIDSQEAEKQNALINMKAQYADKKLRLQMKMNEKKKNIRDIYNSFDSSVDAGGKKFLQNLTQGRITAYKTGWLLFLNEYFSAQQVSFRSQRIEMLHKEWIEQNFA